MDPGNWATDIEGGSKYGYSLIWVLVMSNLIALLLQSHCIRLGVVSGRDLAQASKDHYSKFINWFLYVFAYIFHAFSYFICIYIHFDIIKTY